MEELKDNSSSNFENAVKLQNGGYDFEKKQT